MLKSAVIKGIIFLLVIAVVALLVGGVGSSPACFGKCLAGELLYYRIVPFRRHKAAVSPVC